jgi:hypothetical protein
METATIREWATDAIRYWEPRRVLYNLVLAAIVLACFVVALPVSKGLITLNFVLGLFLLAVPTSPIAQPMWWTSSRRSQVSAISGRNTAGFCS